MTTSELKSRLKSLGMAQQGDKATLEYRIAKGEESVKLGLKTPDGDPVHLLKISKLRSIASKAGISPIGTLDEIMFAYIDYLKTNNCNSGPPSQESKKQKLPTDISEKVLQLAEVDDFIGILQLGGSNLTTSSSGALLRKAYLKLSLVLHPDKNKTHPDATKVFQALVNAYERISEPELVQDVKLKKGQKKAAQISRSNDGCYRTRVRCPRCKNPWSESSVEGNPEYFYNFLMTGIKSFTCATCLLQFGCMTATHECPFCRQSFEYHPSDFHRKINCGGHKCSKTFGFKMFHCSDRVMKNLKEEVRLLREEQMKVTEQRRRRAKAFSRRNCGQDDTSMEATFLLGLSNECPRCGISLGDLEDTDEINHLRNCNDEKKILSNKRKKENARRNEDEKKKRQELQEDVTSKATWDFLGATNENMWMLTDGALQKECTEQGVDAKGKKGYEMIASLVDHRKSQALTEFSGAEGKQEVNDDNLPSNLHSMTVMQLRAVAASRGVKLGSNLRKADIIELLQSEQVGIRRITAGDEDAEKIGVSTGECIEIESDSESDFEPDE